MLFHFRDIVLNGDTSLTLFRTTARVAVLWMTAAHKGLILPKAPSIIAAELTAMVAVKF